MVERNEVLHRYRVQGQSKRQIASEMHISRHTVDKIVWEYERKCLDPNGVCDMDAFAALTGGKPRFNTPERPARVVTDEIKEIIRECLEQNRFRRATGMRKLQWTKKAIHAMLLERGFTPSYPSVCVHVGRISAMMGPRPAPAPSEVYVRREHDPGRECEFDWGEIPLVIGGQRIKVHMAVFTPVHSNSRHAWLFRRQDTLAFMEAHRNFFARTGGVPAVMVYDNMKVAVTIKPGGRGRPANKFPTQTMRRLALYYSFETRFCNARSGWEKGAVERSVEVVRRAAFTPRVSFETMADAQAWLDRTLERLNAVSGIAGVSDEEKLLRIGNDLRAMRPAPQPMGCFEAEEHRPDKYCTVMVAVNHYSVPETLIDKFITVKVYSERLGMYQDGRKVAEHIRLQGKGGWSMQLDHFLSTFLRKPGALDSSTAMRQVPPELAELYRVHFCPDRQREFIEFMMYARDRGILQSQITACARRLRFKGVRHITADHLKVDIDASMIHNAPGGDICPGLQDPIHADAAHLSIEKGAAGTLEALTQAMTHSHNRTAHYN